MFFKIGSLVIAIDQILAAQSTGSVENPAITITTKGWDTFTVNFRSLREVDEVLEKIVIQTGFLK